MPTTLDKPTSLEQEVLAALRSFGEHGATDEEINAAVRDRGRMAKESSTRARRCNLVAAGLVEDSGRTRRTSCDMPAKVWIATKQYDAGEQLSLFAATSERPST